MVASSLCCLSNGQPGATMPETPLKYLQILKKKAAPAEEPDTPDERDATIERLERELAEEAEHTASLRKTIDELRFRSQTLETSYAKQLEDARSQIEKAEEATEGEKARMAEVEKERDEALQELKDAQSRIERLSAGADLMDSMTTGPLPKGPGDSAALSIDEMLADAAVAPDSEKEEQEKQIPPELEEPPEDMLSPDLVFAAKEEA
jgi:DNA repair exonuclease SbcCD ATPase subunit